MTGSVGLYIMKKIQKRGVKLEKLIEKSCLDFTAALASKAPVPGGGGAAALAGALGTALGTMAANFTAGKKKYAAYEADIQVILQKTARIQNRLLALVDEDAEAFAPLSAAYAIPKDAPERAEVLEAAALKACQAPLEMAALCGEAVGLLEELLEKGSVLLLSDVGCGALLCGAALESAALNVFINTGTLQNREQAHAVEAEVDALREQYVPKAATIAETVRRRVRKEG